ncbi:filamentous hemagglutinin N-terminal domain-containing protein [Saccharophagus sp. K07]|uniref:two-partner secretion domain-containing protein n=1 Tax=Saccharophagus sp. K07 TaxID=2283636 RepID=UPI00165273A3|nr:filamentous hemagglutinin N-terminal domain-containing protein [Saccharophagus sp. K07]MBC6905534.1 filamentous hemagglutinin N-terminal domain-containing protein [Saccharophagus sp. K07]
MKTRLLNSKSAKKIPFEKLLSLKLLVGAVAACTVLPYQVYAAPTGGTVVGGTGSINQTGNLTSVTQTSDRLSLRWNKFNVNSNERVEFVQPTASSIVLNRILDSNASQIAGRIDANGRVILMNPNGVIFNGTAVVNVGGLIASGLNIESSDFMNGDLVFSEVLNSSGLVRNKGLITASTGGNVALLGKNVINSGLISADLGHVALASGAEAVVTFDADGLIGVRIDRETLTSELAAEVNNYGVQNSGTVIANIEY